MSFSNLQGLSEILPQYSKHLLPSKLPRRVTDYLATFLLQYMSQSTSPRLQLLIVLAVEV